MKKTYHKTLRVIGRENEVFEFELLSNFCVNKRFTNITDNYRDVLNAMFPDMDMCNRFCDLICDFLGIWDYDLISILNHFNIRKIKFIEAKIKNDEEINARIETETQTYGMCFTLDTIHCVIPDEDKTTRLYLHDANNETFKIEVSATYGIDKNKVDAETADLEITDLLGFNTEYSKLSDILTEYYTTDDYSIYLILNTLRIKDIANITYLFDNDEILTRITTSTGIYVVRFSRNIVFSQLEKVSKVPCVERKRGA